MAVTVAGSGSQTASASSRSVADAVTNTTTTITSATASFVAGDVGRVVTGSADLVAGTYIASVTNGTTALLSVAATGSHSAQTLNLTTEYVLFDTSVAATYTFDIDTLNMASGDITELRVYKMVLTGGTRRVCYFASYSGAQVVDDLIKVSVPAATPLTDTGALRFTVKQTAGTGRVYAWSVNKYA